MSCWVINNLKKYDNITNHWHRIWERINYNITIRLINIPLLSNCLVVVMFHLTLPVCTTTCLATIISVWMKFSCVSLYLAGPLYKALQRWGLHKACWDLLSLQSLYREHLPTTNTHMLISVFFPKYATHFHIFVFNVVFVFFVNYKMYCYSLMSGCWSQRWHCSNIMKSAQRQSDHRKLAQLQGNL